MVTAKQAARTQLGVFHFYLLFLSFSSRGNDGTVDGEGSGQTTHCSRFPDPEVLIYVQSFFNRLSPHPFVSL